jgi:hypothetical protein
MKKEGGLRPILEDLKKKGLSKDDIVDFLEKKGVEPKKARLVTNAYFGESESFSELIQDIKIPKPTEEELAEIKRKLKSDLFHEESGLKIFGESSKVEDPPPPNEETKEPSGGELGNNLDKDAIKELQDLKSEIGNIKKGDELKDQIESQHAVIAKLKDENSKLKSEITRIDGEIANLRELFKEIIQTVKEIRGMLS